MALRLLALFLVVIGLTLQFAPSSQTWVAGLLALAAGGVLLVMDHFRIGVGRK